MCETAHLYPGHPHLPTDLSTGSLGPPVQWDTENSLKEAETLEDPAVSWGDISVTTRTGTYHVLPPSAFQAPLPKR